MVLSLKTLGAMEHMIKKCKMTATATAEALNINAKTVRKYVKNKFKPGTYKARKLPPKVLKRRAALAKLAKKTEKKNHRERPMFGSSSALRVGLFKETKEKLSPRQIRREMKEIGFRSYKRKRVPTRGLKDANRRKAFANRMLRFPRWRSICFCFRSTAGA